MSEENSSEHSYRLAYGVCATFMVGFLLATFAVVGDSLHRGDLERVVSQAIASPTPTTSPAAGDN
ncbi:MAG TPA: hypothetical protein VE641_16240 [Chthoniobacterales bacterium]|jgi:hypothetical protein|nr:hypothetical protein [Chthoniobacterales bacterium]